MPRISLRSRVASLTAASAVAVCGLLLAGLSTDAVGSAADKRVQCSYRTTKPAEVGKRVEAKGRLKCIGADVKRQVLRTCLMQKADSGFTLVKCVTRALNRGGLVTGSVAPFCPKGDEAAFKTRIHVRIRLSGRGVQKLSSDSPQVLIARNCTG